MNIEEPEPIRVGDHIYITLEGSVDPGGKTACIRRFKVYPAKTREQNVIITVEITDGAMTETDLLAADKGKPREERLIALGLSYISRYFFMRSTFPPSGQHIRLQVTALTSKGMHPVGADLVDGLLKGHMIELRRPNTPGLFDE